MDKMNQQKIRVKTQHTNHIATLKLLTIVNNLC